MELFDHDAERMLIGALLYDNDNFLHINEGLKGKHFSDTLNAYIFSAMTALFESKNRVDVYLVGDKLKKDKISRTGEYAYLEDLKDDAYSRLFEGAKNKESILDISNVILEKYKLRQISDMSDDVANKIKNSRDMSSDELEEFINENLSKINYSLVDKNKSIKLTEIAKDLVMDLYKRSENDDPITGLRTGYRDFDLMLKGLQPDDLTIIAARPSMGKTAFVINCLLGIEKNQKDGASILFSAEMSSNQIIERLLAAKARIPLECFKSGNFEVDQWDKLNSTFNKLEDNIYIDDKPAVTVSHIEKTVTRLIKSGVNIKCIAVDYLQKMTGEKSFSRENEVGGISSGLKNIARKFGVQVIALAQLNRSIENRPVRDKEGRPGRIPLMSDLRESGSIEQDADVIGFLYRDEYYEPNTPYPGVTNLIIAKHRNGEKGTINLKWNGKYQLFSNMD